MTILVIASTLFPVPVSGLYSFQMNAGIHRFRLLGELRIIDSLGSDSITQCRIGIVKANSSTYASAAKVPAVLSAMNQATESLIGEDNYLYYPDLGQPGMSVPFDCEAKLTADNSYKYLFMELSFKANVQLDYEIRLRRLQILSTLIPISQNTTFNALDRSIPCQALRRWQGAGKAYCCFSYGRRYQGSTAL